MPFYLKLSYVKVLVTLQDGKARDHAEICAEAGLGGMECTGAISILRRADAIDQAGHHRFVITEKGKILLETAPRIEVRTR